MDPDKQELSFPDHGFKHGVHLKRVPRRRGSVCFMPLVVTWPDSFSSPILITENDRAMRRGGRGVDDAGKLQKKQQVQRDKQTTRKTTWQDRRGCHDVPGRLGLDGICWS